MSTTTTDALEILHQEFYENQPERLIALQEARVNDDVARRSESYEKLRVSHNIN